MPAVCLAGLCGGFFRPLLLIGMLYCQDCGGRYRIPAATADDIDDLCCKTSILIRGKEK